MCNPPKKTDGDLTPRAEKSFSFLQETTKQILTLATAIFALTLTFLKDVAPAGTNTALLEIAWVVYLLSVLAGICTLLALSGNLENPQTGSPSIYSKNIRLFTSLQVGLFFVALVLTLLFGMLAL